jgi:4-amino-4-deoxy-L-arabinose transferase-like glycosyltransferase
MKLKMNISISPSNIRIDRMDRLWAYLRWTSLTFIVGSLLYKFFERSAMFHDEIINVAVGRNADIFNYAARPMFYVINTLGVRILGNSTLALSFMAYAAFLMMAAYTYRYMRRDFGPLAGISAVAALAWSGLIYYIGIRGMPHLYPAVFFIAAIYYYHQIPASEQRWRHRVLVGFFLWLALLCHPTAMALIAGFCVMVALDLLRDWRVMGSGAVGRVVLSWSAIMLTFWALVEGLFLSFSQDHKSYAGYWFAGLHKTSKDVYRHYFEPYGF